MCYVVVRENNDDDDSDSSTYDDWENSIASSQLNSTEHSENELEENEVCV